LTEGAVGVGLTEGAAGVGCVESRDAAKAEGYDEEHAGENLVKNSDAPVGMTVKDEPDRHDRQELREGAVGVGSVESRDAAKAEGYDEEYAGDHSVENSDAPAWRNTTLKERQFSVVENIRERRRSVIETTKAAAIGILHDIEALRDDAVDDIKTIGNKLRRSKPEKGGLDAKMTSSTHFTLSIQFDHGLWFGRHSRTDPPRETVARSVARYAINESQNCATVSNSLGGNQEISGGR
jgi:hypothetical protein